MKEKNERALSELKLLLEISEILDRSYDLRDELYPVLKAISNHTGMLRGTITLLDRERGELHIEAAYGLSSEELARGVYKVGEGIIGKVAQMGRPMVIPKISTEPMFLNKTGSRKNLQKEEISYICVPIRVENMVLGTLSADRLYSDEISLEEDLRVLTIIASMIARAVRLRMRNEEERKALLLENARLQEELKKRFHPSNMIGSSGAIQKVYDLIQQVSTTEATVLIRGESGTGKELVAHAIHFNSNRATGPFIKVNCAALPESVVESELFGHERGAFTGAYQQRKGRFEMAHGGTIFLDEIGDLPLSIQAKLLRVLQDKTFERVGGSEVIKVNVRIITATNRDLEKLVKEEKFREDLFYRLNVFPIFIPPLRERKTDILELANYFVEKYSRENNKYVKRISTPAIDMLMSYHWPGNVRELENVIERAIILTNDDVIHGHHLPPTLQTAEASNTIMKGKLEETLERVEREMIIEALKNTKGNKAKAARELGITERIMGLRVMKLGINPKQYKPQKAKHSMKTKEYIDKDR
ncbi:MAG: sigma 54-interacting transcriptional regulator [Candidatus Hydrogenedens sp.]|nr:sigma 54-interacting transcriptional regulator [Candidatus Hydrogenedens sp.]